MLESLPAGEREAVLRVYPAGRSLVHAWRRLGIALCSDPNSGEDFYSAALSVLRRAGVQEIVGELLAERGAAAS